jgi:hypothetical protein
MENVARYEAEDLTVSFSFEDIPDKIVLSVLD